MLFRNRKKWKIFALLVCFVIAIGFAGCSGDVDEPANGEPTDADTYQLAWSTGGTAGTMYAQGSAMSNYINENSDMLRITPVTSGGGVENSRVVGMGDYAFGFGYTINVYEAYMGIGAFEADEPLTNLRLLGPGEVSAGVHMGVFADSDIESVNDLVGRRITTGSVGSGGQYVSDLFLEHLGIFDDITVEYYGWEDVPSLLRDGEIEAAFRLGAAPLPMYAEIAATRPVRMLDVSQEMAATNFLEEFPFFEEYIIEVGTYDGQDEDAVTYGMPSVIVTHADVPDEVIYEFMRLGYSQEGADHVSGAFPNHDLDNQDPFAEGMLIPLHPAAERFWEEQGVDIPEQTIAD